MIKPLLALFVALPCLPPPAEGPTSLQLTFGVYQTEKATEMYRQFVPLLEGLQIELSERLQVEVDLDMRIFKTYDQGLQALIEGQVDFVRFGPASYVLAKAQAPGIQIIAREQKQGLTTFDGVIFCRADSDVQQLADLRGRSFAFGDENSTIGRYLAQEQLLSAGLRSADLNGQTYLGRHDTVVRAVQMGDFDAGSAKWSTLKKLEDEKTPLRVIDRFPNVTKPWIARAGLAPEHTAALCQTLLECQDQTLLAGFGVTAFIAATDKDYNPTRRAMKAADIFSKSKPARETR